MIEKIGSSAVAPGFPALVTSGTHGWHSSELTEADAGLFSQALTTRLNRTAPIPVKETTTAGAALLKSNSVPLNTTNFGSKLAASPGRNPENIQQATPAHAAPTTIAADVPPPPATVAVAEAPSSTVITKEEDGALLRTAGAPSLPLSSDKSQPLTKDPDDSPATLGMPLLQPELTRTPPTPRPEGPRLSSAEWTDTQHLTPAANQPVTEPTAPLLAHNSLPDGLARAVARPTLPPASAIVPRTLALSSEPAMSSLGSRRVEPAQPGQTDATPSSGEPSAQRKANSTTEPGTSPATSKVASTLVLTSVATASPQTEKPPVVASQYPPSSSAQEIVAPAGDTTSAAAIEVASPHVQPSTKAALSGTSSPLHAVKPRTRVNVQEPSTETLAPVSGVQDPPSASLVLPPQATMTIAHQSASLTTPVAVPDRLSSPAITSPGTPQRAAPHSGRNASTALPLKELVPTSTGRQPGELASPENAAVPLKTIAGLSSSPTTLLAAVLPSTALENSGIGVQQKIVSGPIAQVDESTISLQNSIAANLLNSVPSRESQEASRGALSLPNVLEVGVAHNTEGWLRVRAELQPGSSQVVASVLAGNSAAVESLHKQLPAIAAYLAGEQLSVASVVVERAGAGTAFAGAGSGSAGTSGQAQGSGNRQSNPALESTNAQAGWHDTDDESAGDDLPARYAGASGGWLNVRA